MRHILPQASQGRVLQTAQGQEGDGGERERRGKEKGVSPRRGWEGKGYAKAREGRWGGRRWADQQRTARHRDVGGQLVQGGGGMEADGTTANGPWTYHHQRIAQFV